MINPCNEIFLEDHGWHIRNMQSILFKLDLYDYVEYNFFGAGTLMIKNPSANTVIVNGRNCGTSTDIQLHDLPAGTHTMRLIEWI